jgi:hypothetical protein
LNTRMADSPSLLDSIEDAMEATLRRDEGWENGAEACAEVLRAQAGARKDENLRTCADMLDMARAREDGQRQSAVLEVLRMARQTVLGLNARRGRAPRLDFGPCMRGCCQSAVVATTVSATTGHVLCLDCHRALSYHLDETGGYRWHAHSLMEACGAIDGRET